MLTAALNQMVDSSPSKSSSSRKRKSAGGSNGHAGGRASFGGNGAASTSSHSNGSGGGNGSAAAPRRRSAPKRPLSQSAPPPPPPPPAPPLSRAASASGLFVPKVTFPNYSFSDRSVDALPAASIAPMCARLRQARPRAPAHHGVSDSRLFVPLRQVPATMNGVGGDPRIPAPMLSRVPSVAMSGLGGPAPPAPPLTSAQSADGKLESNGNGLPPPPPPNLGRTISTGKPQAGCRHRAPCVLSSTSRLLCPPTPTPLSISTHAHAVSTSSRFLDGQCGR